MDEGGAFFFFSGQFEGISLFSFQLASEELPLPPLSRGPPPLRAFFPALGNGEFFCSGQLGEVDLKTVIFFAPVRPFLSTFREEILGKEGVFFSCFLRGFFPLSFWNSFFFDGSGHALFPSVRARQADPFRWQRRTRRPPLRRGSPSCHRSRSLLSRFSCRTERAYRHLFFSLLSSASV